MHVCDNLLKFLEGFSTLTKSGLSILKKRNLNIYLKGISHPQTSKEPIRKCLMNYFM